ncbi:Long-chain-fatty-acid--CoA ligase [Variovorax sp. PBS-H4]|uniref:AMP-binding protein n=1 Tax=Variovorax sp. PBS-H4 TaxID=434008 RepID=UPI001319031A|nr:AMP-binding protein [Variovorax sp. PBS-H4]VTU36497.1 Long-chain-fatty-acid--CoA ligase [Variovorax sp. PBS-H4]
MDDVFDLRDLTIPYVLDRQAKQRPDKLFLTEYWTGRTWTYAQMDQWSTRVAHALSAAGAAKGTHIGLFLANSAEHVAVFFAIGKLGAVSVPVNTAARGELLHYYFGHADAEMIVVDEELLPRLAEVLPQLPRIKQVFVLGTDRKAVAAQVLAGLGVPAADLLEATQRAGSEALNVPVKCSDLLMFAFTSGTTGPSKACMLPHAAALTYGTSAAEAQGYRESDIFYVCLPLFHNNALLASMASMLVVGGSMVLSQRFSASRFMAEIRDSHATITNFLGAMSTFLWSQPPQPGDADNDLRLASMSPAPYFTAEFEKRFGLKAMSNYGLSDFGTVSAFVPGAPAEKLGSMGKARRGFELRIVDEDDFECAPDEIGELVIRSHEPWRAATGYYKMPEATVAAHRNQWFHTGDRARRDKDGYFWFVDRKKDCIRRRGENISAFEVERVIMGHPAVANVAVFPVATAEKDEEVGAAVVVRDGQRLSEADLVAHCAANMSYFMVPRYIQVLPELPTTTNQKIEKFKLKQDMEAALGSVWDREQAGIVLKR